MEKLKWITLLCIGLVVGTLLSAPSHTVAQQPAQTQSAQIHAVRATITLLLTDDVNYQVFLPVVVR